MKHAAILVALSIATAPITAMTVDGNTITLTPEEVQGCRAGDGCVFATKAAVEEALKEAAARARMGCGTHT